MSVVTILEEVCWTMTSFTLELPSSVKNGWSDYGIQVPNFRNDGKQDTILSAQMDDLDNKLYWLRSM